MSPQELVVGRENARRRGQSSQRPRGQTASSAVDEQHLLNLEDSIDFSCQGGGAGGVLSGSKIIKHGSAGWREWMEWMIASTSSI